MKHSTYHRATASELDRLRIHTELSDAIVVVKRMEIETDVYHFAVRWGGGYVVVDNPPIGMDYWDSDKVLHR